MTIWIEWLACWVGAEGLGTCPWHACTYLNVVRAAWLMEYVESMSSKLWRVGSLRAVISDTVRVWTTGGSMLTDSIPANELPLMIWQSPDSSTSLSVHEEVQDSPLLGLQEPLNSACHKGSGSKDRGATTGARVAMVLRLYEG